MRVASHLLPVRSLSLPTCRPSARCRIPNKRGMRDGFSGGFPRWFNSAARRAKPPLRPPEALTAAIGAAVLWRMSGREACRDDCLSTASKRFPARNSCG